MSAEPDLRLSLDPASEEYQRKRRKGLRPVVFWVPDTSDPEVRERIRREVQAINNSPHAKEDMDFIESVSVLFDEEHETEHDRLS